MKKVILFWLVIMMTTIVLTQTEIENFEQQENQSFNDFKEKENKAFANFHKQQDSLFIQYKEQIEKLWNEFKESTPNEWVSYNSDFTGRGEVDFKEGKIKVYAVVEDVSKGSEEEKIEQDKKAKEIIKKQIVSILKEKDEITREPILKEQVANPEEKKKVIKEKDIEKIAENIAKKSQKEKFVNKDGKKLIKYQINLKLIPNSISIRLEKYKPAIEKFCQEYDIDIKVVLAIIHTESYFNPKAYNRRGNAYGMMQIVPKYAGFTMNNVLFGKKRKPSSRELFNPDINLNMGIGYMRWLADNKWSEVKNKTNQYYCIICSYNGGPGSVYKAMTGKLKNIPTQKWNKMMNDLSNMSSKSLYNKFRRDIPWEETRMYIKLVKGRMEKEYKDL